MKQVYILSGTTGEQRMTSEMLLWVNSVFPIFLFFISIYTTMFFKGSAGFLIFRRYCSDIYDSADVTHHWCEIQTQDSVYVIYKY